MSTTAIATGIQDGSDFNARSTRLCISPLNFPLTGKVHMSKYSSIKVAVKGAVFPSILSGTAYGPVRR